MKNLLFGFSFSSYNTKEEIDLYIVFEKNILS